MSGLVYMKTRKNYILSPSQIAEIVWLYDRRGLSPYRIAKMKNRKTGQLRFPVAPNTIRYHLERQAGEGVITLRDRREAARKHLLDIEDLKRMYLLPPEGEGLSVYAIAKKLSPGKRKISPATIYTTLRDAGVEMRTYEKAKELERERNVGK